MLHEFQQRFAEEKARDALEFEPLPPSNLVSIDGGGIYINVRYNEKLSRILRSLPWSEWDSKNKRWKYPFKASEYIRRALPSIEKLARAAQSEADEETRRREDERKRFELNRMEENAANERRLAMMVPRPLLQEYLHPITKRPRFALSFESIGDKSNSFIPGSPARYWVCQVFGSNGRGGWAKAYINGVKDFSCSNSNGSRGVMVTFFLEEGPIYDVKEPISWKNFDRYFLRISNGTPIRLSEERVKECLVK